MTGFLSFVFAVFVLNPSDKQDYDSSYEYTYVIQDESATALVKVEEYVLKDLKRPAVFKTVYSGRSVDRDGNVYHCDSYVDTRDDTGERIRRKFYCSVERISRDHWKLLKLRWGN